MSCAFSASSSELRFASCAACCSSFNCRIVPERMVRRSSLGSLPPRFALGVDKERVHGLPGVLVELVRIAWVSSGSAITGGAPA
eukprot:3756062-Prymnesium_polylepis.1